MRIGVIGAGRMGGAMAGRLLAGGHEVIIHVRGGRRLDDLIAQGGVAASELAQVCASRQLVLTMLPSDESLQEVTAGPGGIIEALPAGAVHMVSGTHGAPLLKALAEAHDQVGQTLVCCPVLGRPERAAEGKLGLIAAGPGHVLAALRPVFEQLAETIFEAGEDPVSAAVAKIANNFILGCAIEAIGEGMALVRRYGVEAPLFHEVLTKGLFDCVAYRGYGDLIAHEDWGRVGAAATIGLKDATLALQAAEAVGAPLPSALVWRDHLAQAIARGEGALDWSVMAREQFRRSGLE